MKSFLQFIEDAPVRKYNDPSVITSPSERARAGEREKDRDRQARLDQQDARNSIRKEPTTSEKEAILGAGRLMGQGFDDAGAAGKKEDDRKPLNLRPKRTPAHEALKNSYLEKLSEKEGFIPANVRASLDSITKDRDEDDKIKTSRFKSANKVIDSISGKHPLMDVLSGAMASTEEPSGYQKRLQSIKEMIDNDDDGDVDEDLHLLIKQRLGLKGKSASFIEKLENEGLNPYEFMDTSKSAELSSDLNIEDFNADGSDFIPKYARQISKSLKGIPNARAGDFLDSLDQAQKKYKDDDIDYDYLRKLFSGNDELDEFDDREYEGLNTTWDLSSQGFSANGVEPLDGVERDSALEVAWTNLLNPSVLDKLKKRIENGEGNVEETLEEMMSNGEQRHQQKMMSMVNDYSEKSGSSIRDILGTEDGLTGFQDYLKLMTVLDAKRTWKDQIFPDLEDGDVLRNMPMYGGRDGNARERIYKQAGFGELLGDDYQYGQKVEGEKKLKPLDDTNIGTFDEDVAKENTFDSVRNMMQDLRDTEVLPFYEDDFLEYVQDQLDWMDREDLQRISDDPEDFFETMQERMVDRELQSTYFASEMNDIMGHSDGNPIEDFYQDLDDRGIELSEFDNHIESYINHLDYEDQVELLRSIRSSDSDKIKEVAANIVADYKEDNEWEEEEPNAYFANQFADILDEDDENPIKDLYKELEDKGLSADKFNEYLQNDIESMDKEERQKIAKLIYSRDYDRIETIAINIVGKYKREVGLPLW